MWKKVKYPENFIKILNIKICKALKSIKSSLILQHSIAYGVVFGKTKYFAILINLISRFDLQQHFVKCWKKFQILQRLFDTLDNFSLQKPSTFQYFFHKKGCNRFGFSFWFGNLSILKFFLECLHEKWKTVKNWWENFTRRESWWQTNYIHFFLI